MSGYILCQVKRAKNPYYISNISTNIYSIEELCYYLYHNIYLLDETIINEQLLVWMKRRTPLKKTVPASLRPSGGEKEHR